METLFDDENQWQKEWKDMPEFIQNKQKPYKQLIVRFRNKKDYEDFAELINQKLTPKTKSLWIPKLIRGVNSGKTYENES